MEPCRSNAAFLSSPLLRRSLRTARLSKISRSLWTATRLSSDRPEKK